MAKTDKPFRKAFSCAGIHSAVLVIWAVVSYNSGGEADRLVGMSFSAALITGLWARFDSKPWTWQRFIITYLVLFAIPRLFSGF